MPPANVESTESHWAGWARRPRRWFVVGLGIAGGSVFAAVALYFVASHSSRYRLEHVLVYGASALAPSDVRMAAGITTEDNLLSLDKAAIKSRIEAHPYVASAEIQVEFPNTLVIQLTEREAMATLSVGRRIYLIDCDGYVLSELPLGDPIVGPFITELHEFGVVNVGDHLEQTSLQDALNQFEGCNPAEDSH